MRFIGLSLFTTVACALFVGALPAEHQAGGAVVQLDARAESISDILTTAANELTTVKNNIDAMTPGTADPGAVTENLEKVKSILSDTIGSIQVLRGIPIAIFIKSLATLVAIIVTLSVTIISIAINLVGKAIVGPFIYEIGVLLVTFLKLMAVIVPGILAIVATLIVSVIALLKSLDLYQVLDVLGVKA